MIKLVIISILCASLVVDHSDLPGKYKGIHGLTSYELTLDAKGTYVQSYKDCTTNFSTKGRWTQEHDTITLDIEKVLSFYPRGKKNEVDSTSYAYEWAFRMNKYLIGDDRLYLLVAYRDTILPIPLPKEGTEFDQPKPPLTKTTRK